MKAYYIKMITFIDHIEHKEKTLYLYKHETGHFFAIDKDFLIQKFDDDEIQVVPDIFDDESKPGKLYLR